MKQAIVLIHGIGEQKPMSTLRSFVSSILPPAAEGHEQYWSKPDPMSDLFELRRLQAPGRWKAHFYEYYWAYQVEGTKLRHLAKWFFELLFRKWHNIPTALRGIWLLSWTLTSFLVIVAAGGGFAYIKNWYVNQPKYGLLWILILFVIGTLQGFLVKYVGDAARYLSRHPRNIALRQKIRAEGIQLLKELHDSRSYDRIIVVGHSLGSVIGYDLITQLWNEYNSVFEFKTHKAELAKFLAEGKSPQPVIRNKLPKAGADLISNRTHEALERYRTSQLNGWKEQRRWGNPWRISDFVTLGSPLAHSMILHARDRDEFEARKRQREFPTCPPVCDTKGFAYPCPIAIDVGDGKKFSSLILHHAAPFAVTRWTNIYFRAYLGLFGDIIGGPLQQVFGLGIMDIPVKLRSFWKFSPSSHTAYWRVEQSPKGNKQEKGESNLAVDVLRRVLELDHSRKFRI